MTRMPSTVEVVHDPDAQRYVLRVDGREVGFADARVRGEEVVFPHTVVVPEERGKGWAEVLVERALQDVRDRGLSVVPTCWYVQDYIAAHPEHQDLLASRKSP